MNVLRGKAKQRSREDWDEPPEKVQKVEVVIAKDDAEERETGLIDQPAPIRTNVNFIDDKTRISDAKINTAIEREDDHYALPEDYVTSDGKIDKERQLDNLKENYQKSKRSTTHDSNWEEEQLKKAQQLQYLDEHIPGLKEYEFVFDESQFVDFDEDAPLEGDDLEEDFEVRDDNDESDEFDVNNDGIHSNRAQSRKKMEFIKRLLPVFRYRQKFLKAVQDNQVLIVVGETGSGKTTQLPQYLMEDGYCDHNGKLRQVVCTQPRRVAATSVAQRVAEEVGVDLGSKVGYTVRFDDKSSNKTAIRYVTDGMLLRELLNDPLLMKCSVIMIDEAHERTISTELLLSLLHDILQERKDLRLIVASATINAEKFSDFFSKSPIFTIPGRRFPVDVYYTKSPEANYIQAAITTVFQIHTSQDKGDILVFLTGQEEIETMTESLRDSVTMLGDSVPPLLVCPLYANLPPEAQQSVFEPTPPDSRKVVLATNIAETSITIDGIKYVVDPGYVKQKQFNAALGMDSLVVVPCSRASADQRAGRAGRVGPGKCFRLFTKWSFYNEFEENSIPEILRSNLLTVVLLLLSMGINDLVHFAFLDPPSSDALARSLELLYALGALKATGAITNLGKSLSELPIDPMLGKCLISSAKFGVFESTLSTVAMLSESGNLFYRPKDKKEQADQRHQHFKSPHGDHITLLNIWKEWEDSGYSSLWCEDNYVQYRTLKRVKSIKDQLFSQCSKIGLTITDRALEEADRLNAIQKSIVAGYFLHVCRLSQSGEAYLKLKKKQSVHIHPSSMLFSMKPPPRLILYHELVLTSKEFMRNCLIVDEKMVEDFGGHYYSPNELKLIKKTVSF